MSSTTVDNRALLLGENNKQARAIFEAAAGSERTIPAGSALNMKIADGTKFQLHSLNPDEPIQGILLNDLLVAADAGTTDHTIERVIDGHIDMKLYVAANGLTTIDDIPGAGLQSHRLQLESKGMIPIFRENL